MTAHAKKDPKATDREKLIKARNRLTDKIFGFLKINIIILLIDIFIIKSGLVIPSFVLFGTSIGLISSLFNYFSARAKTPYRQSDLVTEKASAYTKKAKNPFYDEIQKELDEIRVKIIKTIEKCSNKVKIHKNRVINDIESINRSIKILMEKGRNIDAIIKEIDIKEIEDKKKKLRERYSETDNEMLKNDLLNHMKVLNEQMDKYKKLIESEEMIMVKIESTKSSLSSLILDLTRIDLDADIITESELDVAINNIEMKTIELNTLSEILDRQDL